MGALTVTDGFDLVTFRAWMAAHLPAYARPVFLRFRDALEVTETFKQKKAALVADGFDPTRIADALFVDDPTQGAYRPLDRDVFRHIEEGRFR